MKSSVSKLIYHMVLEANSQNMEILQFDWLISGGIFPVLPALGGFKKPSLVTVIVMVMIMAVAASGQNMEVLQFGWLISGRIFPLLPAQGGFKKPSLCRTKIKIFDHL